MMELVPIVLNDADGYCGGLEGTLLLERAIAWRISKGEENEAAKTGQKNRTISDDYASLIEIYTAGRSFSTANPYANRYLRFLENHPADSLMLARARAMHARLLQEQGQYAQAQILYQKCLPELKRGPTSQYSAAMQGLAQCLQMQQKYSEALQYVKQLLTLPPEPNKNSGQLHAWIGVLLDLSNQPDAAVASYRKARAASGADSYEIWEPLRQACQAESDRKRFDVADSLFKRNLELLEPTADNTIAICNIWCQIARMHKYANHKAKAQQAYQKALAVLQSSGNKPSSKEQVENIRKEMGQ